MEDIDGGLHPALDGQSLEEDEDEDPQAWRLIYSKAIYLITFSFWHWYAVILIGPVTSATSRPVLLWQSSKIPGIAWSAIGLGGTVTGSLLVGWLLNVPTTG